MSDSDEQTNPSLSSDAMNLQDLVSGLDFTPKWAKSTGSEGVRRAMESVERPPRDVRNRRDGRDRDRGPRRPGPPRGERKEGPREAFSKPNNRRDRPPPREPRIFLPVEVSFIPDRDRLGAVVHHLHALKRAFPLPYLAHLFLTKPVHHWIKLEAKPSPGGEPLQFFQDRETKAVFLSIDALNDFLVRKHLERHFEREEQAIEPPTGNFVCVGRCKRSGELLGPPNYHGYSERMQEIHRTHFPHLSLDDYRGSIEMVREPEVIERWKESCRTQVRYRPKDTPDAAVTLTLGQAENLFMQQHAAAYVVTGSKVILPASAMEMVSDERLRQVINAARSREDRFPFSMMLAVRPAFRRMRLHLFKVGKGETYVTAIPPKPLDAQHAIPSIRDMIDLLAGHPGWSRHKLIEKLYPGKNESDPEVVEKMGPLGWLVEKGHVIEFFNGTYAIPGHLRMAESLPAEKPAEHHHPELNVAIPATAATPPPPPDLDEPASPVDSPADDAPSQC